MMLRRSTLVGCTLALLSGCATGATASGMTIARQDATPPSNPALAGTFAVGQVEGGQETSGFGTPKIDNASFREALVESLRAAGLLSSRPDAPLSLDVRLVKLEQPSMGLSMTVTSVVHYTVRERQSGAVIIDQDISAAYTATFGDAFAGAKRIHLATEGSARTNIAALVKELNKIRVAAPPVAAAPST